MDIIKKCDIDKLKNETGIFPRLSWYNKKNKIVYYLETKNNGTIAFLYKNDAINYLKNILN